MHLQPYICHKARFPGLSLVQLVHPILPCRNRKSFRKADKPSKSQGQQFALVEARKKNKIIFETHQNPRNIILVCLVTVVFCFPFNASDLHFKKMWSNTVNSNRKIQMMMLKYMIWKFNMLIWVIYFLPSVLKTLNRDWFVTTSNHDKKNLQQQDSYFMKHLLLEITCIWWWKKKITISWETATYLRQFSVNSPDLPRAVSLTLTTR